MTVEAPREAARPTRGAPPPGELLRGYWREFRSMRTALVLLFMVAAASVLGSLFPQRTISPQRVDQYARAHPAIAPVLDRLGLFDVFGSAWYMAIYVALLGALVACLVPRVRAYARLLRARPPRGGQLERYRNHASFEVAATPEEAAAAAGRVLRARRFRVHPHAAGELAAEKGYLREAGSLVFHVSFLLLLVGLAWGKGAGYRGQVALIEGESLANARVNYDSFTPGRYYNAGDLPPFTLRLDDFSNSFYPDGTPSRYASQLSAFGPDGRPVGRQQVTVNHPMTVDGVRIFQSDYGYAPVVRVTGPDGQVLRDEPVELLRDPASEISSGAVKLPELAPQVGLELTFFTGVEQVRAADGTSAIGNDPRLVNPVLAVVPFGGDLQADRAQSIFTLDHTRLRPLLPAGSPPLFLRPGQTVALPGGLHLALTGIRQYSVLTLARDPGVPVVGSAAALILVGLLPSLYVTRRRMWLRATPLEGGRTRVDLGGLALQGKIAFVEEFEELARRVEAALDVQPRPKDYAVTRS